MPDTADIVLENITTAQVRWRDIAFNIDQLDGGGALRHEVAE